jgi:hypothetical protein
MSTTSGQLTYEAALKAAKEGTIIAKVRRSGDTHIARIGQGKSAVTASSTTHPAIAAIAAMKKYLYPWIASRSLIARQIPRQDRLPGLKLKEDEGVSHWRVGMPVSEGGVL